MRAFRFGLLGVFAVALLAISFKPALAICTPAAGVGTPAFGTTVTCSDATTDQNAPNGYGFGSQNGLAINVQSGASVTGTDNGFNLGTANAITNLGTIIGQNLVGVLGTSTLTVTNRGNISGDVGVAADVVNLTNYGGIVGISSGVAAVSGAAIANIANYGTITGGDRGIEGGILNLTNAGNIFATRNGTGAAISFVNANIVNTSSGLISGTIRGIAATDANVVNYGTIRATGVGGLGINAQTGTVTNFGTVSASGAGANAVAVDSNMTINNAGTISANTSSGIAVFGNNATVNLNNTGTIIGGIGVLANGAGSAPWVINNAGSIIGTAVIAGTTFAIELSSSGGDTLNFLPGSRIGGRILLGVASNVNFYAGNIASLTTFGLVGLGGGLVASGSTAAVLGGAPYAIGGDIVAVLDPTALGLADKTLANFTNGVSSLVSDRVSEAGVRAVDSGALAFASSQGATASYDAAPFAFAGHSAPAARAATTVWTKAFGGLQHRPGEGATLDAKTANYGAALGIDRHVTAKLLLGVFIGAGEGRLRVASNSQSVNTEYGFGGFYGRYDWAMQFVDFTLTSGFSRNASKRAVTNNLNGLESAGAAYNGWFVSPEIAYGIRIPVQDFVAMPRARLRYLVGWFDGYAEAGSAQNLSVGSREVQNLEERLELALARLDPLGGQRWLKTTVTAGALASQRLGGSSVDAVLIGQNIHFATPGDDRTFGFYTGAAFDYRLSPTTNLFAAAEGTLMSDKTAAIIARGGIAVSF